MAKGAVCFGATGFFGFSFTLDLGGVLVFVGFGFGETSNLLNSQKKTEVMLRRTLIYLAFGIPLGLILIQFLNQKEKGQEMLKQALADAEGLPQQEYLMIKAVNRWYVEENFNLIFFYMVYSTSGRTNSTGME